MEAIANNSKNITFPWFTYSSLVNLKKLVLVYNNDIKYSIELLDRPTKPYLQGALIDKSRWWKRTRSDDHIFDKEWGDTKTLKEVNKIIREGFKISEIIKRSELRNHSI